MKKVVIFLTAIMAMLVVLSGCGAKPAEIEGVSDMEVSGYVPVDVIDVSEDEVSKWMTPNLNATVGKDLEAWAKYLARVQVEYGDVLDLTMEHQPLAPEIIIDDYLSGRQQYLGQYYRLGKAEEVIALVYLGDAHISWREYMPDTTYSSAEWTPEELIKSYEEQTEPWRKGYESMYLFSNDYRHLFEISDNWLYVDDIKVQLMGQTCETMDPVDILDLYQRGEWDGATPLFSPGCAVSVKVDPTYGALMYQYMTMTYEQGADPLQMAYMAYDEAPTFMTTRWHDQFKVEQGLPFLSNLKVYYYCENKLANTTQSAVTVSAFVDLPNGSKDDIEDAITMQYSGPEVGTYVFFPDRIELYRQGELLETWECEIAITYPSVYHRSDSSAYKNEVHAYISDEEIIRLLPDGKIETVLDNIVGIYNINERDCLLELSLKDKKVRGYSARYGLVDIAENIASIDYFCNITLMTGEDGLCYAFGIDDYETWEQAAKENIEAGRSTDDVLLTVRCLGEEPWKYWLEMYQDDALGFDMDYYHD